MKNDHEGMLRRFELVKESLKSDLERHKMRAEKCPPGLKGEFEAIAKETEFFLKTLRFIEFGSYPKEAN